ncbi:hypothetical protein DDJ31_13735 [Streptomyces griseoviridis]|uniref:Uncharacterized protein n=1 Tax=Streptomyces griseoviridis TaxID=45398 RepID=A0ABX5TSR2_STRGD|nr:hypothetical protein DDJ31_13735 [Streptomyces griseoviridis]
MTLPSLETAASTMSAISSSTSTTCAAVSLFIWTWKPHHFFSTHASRPRIRLQPDPQLQRP